MVHNQKISPLSAIIININVMLGAGLFVNTAILAQRAGPLGFLGYAITGLLLFPLILCIAELIRLLPQGGFYGYAATAFSPLIGFISTWSYFTAKLASAGVTLHTAMLLLQQLIPFLQSTSTLTLDCIVLGSFITLNMHNVKTGSSIQSFFMGAKLVPLFTAIFGGLWLFKGEYFNSSNLAFEGIPSTIPLVLYATIGFEAAVSLSSSLEDPEKNGPRVIITSYSIVILFACLYQLFFYGALGQQLSMLTDFRQSFALLFDQLFGCGSLGKSMTSLTYLAIASSALGGCYGILFSNHWNLYKLAQNKQIFGYHFFSALNKNHIPWLCVLTEGIICLTYLITTKGTLIILQQISGLGTVITYTLSVLSLIYLKKINAPVRTPWWLMLLGLSNCIILVSSCIRGLLMSNSHTLIGLAILMAIGISIFVLAKLQRNQSA